MKQSMHLLIMGAPGAGKGTYAARIKDHYGIPHISTGDMFREAMAKETKMGILAKSFINKGELVPDSVTIGLVKERLSKKDCIKGFILDGFPRNTEQAIALMDILNELNLDLDAVVNINVDDKIIVERIVNRRICSKCGKGYNLISLKPLKEGICDTCGSALYTRKDDNEETIQNRLNVYYQQTKPLVEFYDKLNLVVEIHGNGSIDEIVQNIITKVEAK